MARGGERLGSIGTYLELEVRVGDALGPFDFTECRDENGALIDFSGSTFSCDISLRDGNSTALVSPAVTVVALGHFRIEATPTAALNIAGLDFWNATAKHSYKLRRTTAGVPVTEFYGPVLVAAEGPE